MTTLVGVAQCGWSVHIRDLSHILSFFSCCQLFFFLLSSPRAQIAFLDQSGQSIRQNVCFRPRMCLWGSRQCLIIFKGSTPKTSPNDGIGIFKHERRN